MALAGYSVLSHGVDRCAYRMRKRKNGHPDNAPDITVQRSFHATMAARVRYRNGAQK